MAEFDRAAIEERLNKYRRAREAFLGRQNSETGKSYEAAHAEWQWHSLEDILSCLAEIDRLEREVAGWRSEAEELGKAWEESVGGAKKGGDAEGGE
jgi:hypothetical protein